MISYNTRLVGSQEDLGSLRELLRYEQSAFNEASKIQFSEPKASIVILHAKFYRKYRTANPDVPSQVLVRAEQECLSAYRTIKSNKHRISKPVIKKRLSMRLDKRLCSKNKGDSRSIKITTTNGRRIFKFVLYPQLQNLLDHVQYCDPLIYVDDRDNLCVSFTFDTRKPKAAKSKLCLGVDLGIRVPAACSDGRLIIDRSFNHRKRKLRHLKDSLKSKDTKSARRHLRAVRHKEYFSNRNQSHLVANAILKTDADTIALENLKGIKAKKHRFHNLNAISQVPIAELRRILTYKAEDMGKTILLVNPAYTSQTDSITGKVEGERRGRRFYAKSGLVYDADLNAARNIAHRSKLPVSYGNVLDGQGVVTHPIVCQSSLP